MRRFTITILSAIILIFTACQAQTPPGAGAKTLRIVLSYKIQNLEPTKAANYFLVEFGAAETPLLLDENSNLKPHLLESWQQVDDLNWRLTLRPNIKFQNGKPLTAQKLADAMNRQLRLSPATKSILPNASVKVTGEREVVLTTDAPDPNVPAALADEAIFLVYDAEAVEGAGGDPKKLIESKPYTGAYQIARLDDRELLLERFGGYWQGTPALETVSVRSVADAQARILAVQSGEADIALFPPTETKRMLANQKNAFFIQSVNASGGPRLFFNVRRPPFDETNVRRAASLGINYEVLAKNVMDGVFETATGFYPPVYPWAIQNQKTGTEEANRLLEEANWKLNADGLRYKNNRPLTAVFLVYPQQPDWTTLATAIQAQLREIGFDLKIRQVEDINQAMKTTADWNAAINSPGIISSGGAPDSSLSEHLSTSGERNYGGISDTVLDDLINELSRTFDANKRNELLGKIQQIVIAEKTYEVRPVFSRSRIVVGREFRNYQPSARLRYVTFETKADE